MEKPLETLDSNDEKTDDVNVGAASAASPSTKDPRDEKIAQLEAQVKEKENKYLYLYAEFDNFKKRAIKERSDLLKFGWESLALELLQTLDNLERALAHTKPDTDKNLLAGLNMILNHFRGALQKQGVQAVPSVGQMFDLNLHEAVGQEASDQPSGQIVREEQKGYTLHGRLLRPARVVISTGPKA